MLVAALCEERGRSAWLDRLTIDATDVDRESMARAQGGTYQREAFQETPADLVDRFTQAASLGLAIVPELRRRVRVRELDLTAAPIATPTYDLVLCRNVVIYFDRPMQERLFSAFADALRPGGILVLGKVETLLGPARERFHLSDARERIYERAA
jgi:chemotaxis methyl-accepting protein methylase